MKILSKQEVKKQKAKKAFNEKIKSICKAFGKGMLDRNRSLSYQGIFTNKSLEVAYDIGWNGEIEDFGSNANS